MLGLNGREWKKKKKRKILLGNFCEREWQDVLHNFLFKKQHFSTSQQDSQKCENWKNHFSRFFSRRFFSIRRVTTRRAKHNEKTHKERTKQEEEVKRKSKENQLLFRGFFLKGEKEDIFQKEFENTDKWQHVF